MPEGANGREDLVKLPVMFAATATFGALALTAAGGAPALTGPNLAGNGNGGNHETRGTQTHDCGDGDTIVYDGPLVAWPPNHKYRDVSITATDASGDMVMLMTSGRHDEMVSDTEEMNGAGHTDPATDVKPPTAMAFGSGSATTHHQFRAERSGRGDGRTYTFTADATFDNGSKMCHAEFTSTVPHDKGHHGGAKNRRRAR